MKEEQVFDRGQINIYILFIKIVCKSNTIS